jgi:hypothetical protein
VSTGARTATALEESDHASARPPASRLWPQSGRAVRPARVLESHESARLKGRVGTARGPAWRCRLKVLARHRGCLRGDGSKRSRPNATTLEVGADAQNPCWASLRRSVSRTFDLLHACTRSAVRGQAKCLQTSVFGSDPMVRPAPVHNGSTPMQTHLPTGETENARDDSCRTGLSGI